MRSLQRDHTGLLYPVRLHGSGIERGQALAELRRVTQGKKAALAGAVRCGKVDDTEQADTARGG